MARIDAAAHAVAAEAVAAFRARFDTAPTHAAAAPGRVNLIGEHTDYTGGLAMPFAIDRYTVVCVRATQRNVVRAASTRGDATTDIALDERPLARAGDWSDYPRGIIEGLRGAGVETPGADLLVHSNLPTGRGLSSSAALEIATARALLALAGERLEPDTLVRLAQRAEHDYAGTPCGTLDQFTVVNARAGAVLRFDSRALTATNVTIADPDLAFAVVDSGVQHALADGSYAVRRRELETAETVLGDSLRDVDADRVETIDDAAVARRARHVVTANARVDAMAEALAAGDRARVGALLYQGHESMSRDFEAACDETDTLVALAAELGDAGIVGARQTGGGFGGGVLVVADAARIDTALDVLSRRYRRATGIEAGILRVRPVAGAHDIDPTEFP